VDLIVNLVKPQKSKRIITPVVERNSLQGREEAKPRITAELYTGQAKSRTPVVEQSSLRGRELIEPCTRAKHGTG